MNKKDKTLKVSLLNTGLLKMDVGKGLKPEEVRYIALKMLAMYPSKRKTIVPTKIDIAIDND